MDKRPLTFATKAELARHAASLEGAVVQASRQGKRPGRLFALVVDFLTRFGESEVMAAWVKDAQLAEGRIQEPHDGPPTVSVIVPCHNYGRYLAECARSVLMQTFRAWELIIVNDGSTDDTAEVAAGLVAAHPGHRIRYIEQERRGIVQPRNRGVTLAKGEFVLPLDADDLLAPTFLERTCRHLQERPGLGYVSTRALFFGSVNKIWPSEPFAPLALFATNQQTNTTLYRKAMWKDVGGYDERMVHGYMDWEFWIRCTKMGWFGEQLEEPLFFYRRKMDSVVMRAKKRDADIKEQIIRLHPDIYDADKLAAVSDQMQSSNWIPPDLIRSPRPTRQRPGAPALPGGAAVDSRPTAALEALSRQVLEALSQIVPELQAAFKDKAAGGGDPNAYLVMAERLAGKISVLLNRGEARPARELAASLLAAYPLEKSAALLFVKTLAAGGDLEAAYETGRLYAAVFADALDLFAVMADLLRRLAAGADAATALGLLDGAALLAPGDAAVQAALDAVRARSGQTGTATAGEAGGPVVWYVTDCFGYGAGGVNGVSQAKSMTLSSLLRGADGPPVCVRTPLRPNLPEAMAEFARHLAAVSGPDGWRWPTWIATTDRPALAAAGDGAPVLSGGERPVRPIPAAPSAVIAEGVRLDAHKYLQTLGLTTACPKLFVHHTSPDQFRDKYTDMDMLPETLRALAGYDYCACVSANVIGQWRQLEGLAEKTWIHIPNCAREEEAAALLGRDRRELRRSLELPEEGFIGLCLASVQARKGQDVLLGQLAEVLHRLPGALFLFVGPILSEWGGREILDFARRHFSPAHVRFLGARRNALEYLHAADCLVLPSREEALPLTILEAMTLGKPCVASDVNGIPELVVPGETGLLFSHAVPRDLARHIVRLGNDPALAAAMGHKARERYQREFSRQSHAARWRQTLETMFARASKD